MKWAWAKEKHTYLRRYLEISRATRKKYIGDRKGGAVYFDIFCAPTVRKPKELAPQISQKFDETKPISPFFTFSFFGANA